MSAGIAEALVETALGLFVAIPAVWFYNYLTGRLEYFNVEMDNSSSELVDYFIKKTALSVCDSDRGWRLQSRQSPISSHESQVRGESAMAMDVGGAKGGVKSDINVTPLVDVMLVLLIIMMIVAPLLQKGVAVTLPIAANSAEKPETQDQTVVAVTRRQRVLRQRRAGAARTTCAAASTTSSRTRRRRSSSSRPTRTRRTARSWKRWTSSARPASRTWASSPSAAHGRPGGGGN